MRRLAGHVPVGEQPVAQVLLVVAGLDLAGLIALGGPEAAGIRGQALVDERELAGDHAELELGVRDDDALRAGIVGRGGVDGQRRVAQARADIGADDLDHALEADVLVVQAELGLGRRGEDGLGDLRRLDEALGQHDAAHGPVDVVGLLAGAREVAAHDALDGQRACLLDEHRAAGEVAGVGSEALGEVRHVGRDHMVGDEVRETLEPELRDAREDLALVGDLIGQDVVERGDAVGDDEQQAVAAIVDVADLAAAVGTEFLGHLDPPRVAVNRHNRLIIEDGCPAGQGDCEAVRGLQPVARPR